MHLAYIKVGMPTATQIMLMTRSLQRDLPKLNLKPVLFNHEQVCTNYGVIEKDNDSRNGHDNKIYFKILLIRRRNRKGANATTHNTLDSVCQITYWIIYLYSN